MIELFKTIADLSAVIKEYEGWVLEKADIPCGFKFVADRAKKGHYFLTVTETMHISKLVRNLKLIAHRMSVIRNGAKVL